MVIITCKRRAGAGGELEHFLLFSTKGRIQWSCRLSINEFQTRTTTQIHHQESMFDTAECALPWFQSKFRIFRFLRHEGSRYHRKVCHPTGKRRQRRRWDRWGLARLNGRYTDSKQRVAVMYQAWWRQGQGKGWWVSVVHVYNDHSRSDKSETGYASGSTSWLVLRRQRVAIVEAGGRFSSLVKCLRLSVGSAEGTKSIWRMSMND